MRSSVADQSNWLARRRRRQVLPVASDGRQATASMQGRAKIIRDAWSRIYEAHKSGEPSFHGFLAAYGPTLQRAAVDLPVVEGNMLRNKLGATKNSAPGKDKWGIQELKLLAAWAPNLFDSLARLLTAVERHGVWPEVLAYGSVCFIPKDLNDAVPTAMQHRPITVLSAIYRLWSAVRHDQLSCVWLPHWAPSGAYGLKGRPAADSLVFDTCAYLAGASQDGRYVGGISYDFDKCFDRVPTALAINILRARGCDSNLCRALDGFYSSHVKHFRLEGHYDEPFRPANGLVQGCPLSMLVLSSMVACWHEHLQATIPAVVPKSYADDISVCSQAARPRQVRTQVVSVHASTQQFSNRSGLKINCGKSFTFGHHSLQGSLPSVPCHKQTFRLTGGTVKLSPEPCWSQLEQEKAAKWSASVANIRRLPVGWFTKVTWLQRVFPQLTWAQGTHRLVLPRDQARTLRAKVVRALLDIDDYSASPHVMFALLAPPSHEPEFAMNLSALRRYAFLCGRFSRRNKRVLLRRSWLLASLSMGRFPDFSSFVTLLCLARLSKPLCSVTLSLPTGSMSSVIVGVLPRGKCLCGTVRRTTQVPTVALINLSLSRLSSFGQKQLMSFNTCLTWVLPLNLRHLRTRGLGLKFYGCCFWAA